MKILVRIFSSNNYILLIAINHFWLFQAGRMISKDSPNFDTRVLNLQCLTKTRGNNAIETSGQEKAKEKNSFLESS